MTQEQHHLSPQVVLIEGTVIGAAVGAGLLGWLAYALCDGSLAIAGLGQFCASGTRLATFIGAGAGLAFGALAGALRALFGIPFFREKGTEQR